MEAGYAVRTAPTPRLRKMNFLRRPHSSRGHSSSSRMSHTAETLPQPQITLNLTCDPPVLDTQPQKQRRDNSNSRPGQWFHQLWNMFSPSPIVTWVNPDMVREQQPPHYDHYPGPHLQYSMVPAPAVNPSTPLWYPAAPGGVNLQMMDPLMMMQNQSKGFCVNKPVPQYYPTQPPCKVPITKPLNPYAKEWVPKNYPPAVFPNYTSDVIFLEKVPDSPAVPAGPVIPSEPLDFCEITEKEVDAVRNVDQVQPTSINCSQKPHINASMGNENEHSSPVSLSSSALNMDLHDESVSAEQHNDARGLICLEKGITTPKTAGDSVSVTAECKGRNQPLFIEDTSLTYAGVVGRATPSPTPSPKKDMGKYNKVEQPLPKIFQCDKVYPKETAAPLVDNKHQKPDLFKQLSKNQKNCSKKFLQEMKESCQNDNLYNGGYSPSPDLSMSPDLAGSISPLQIGPQLASSPKVAGSHGSSWSSSEAGSRMRSSSESSITSKDSLDIEFGGEDEVDRKSGDQSPAVSAMAKESQTRSSPQFTSNILACILGQDDSETEDSEDGDWDSDWDEVCVESMDLDSSWEVFGLGLVITDCKPTKTSPRQGSDCQGAKEECCGASQAEEPGTLSLNEINKRWDREVAEDVKGKSKCRVSFGSLRVHPMVVWDHAYRAARHGPWEQFGRDRVRFRQRVASLEPVLTPALDPSHRAAVYCRLHPPTSPSSPLPVPLVQPT